MDGSHTHDAQAEGKSSINRATAARSGANDSSIVGNWDWNLETKEYVLV